MSAPHFRHDRPGTQAAAWSQRLAERTIPALELPDQPGRMIVVGAHPDDETLGVGGLIHLASRAGWDVEVVSVTAGEGSHPHSRTIDVHKLAERRRRELDVAVARLAPTARVECLGHPDGEVADAVEDVSADLVRRIGTDGATTILVAHWRRDGHPDHEAVGRAAATAARRTGARLVEYPVWLWHWGAEVDVPWADARAMTLDAEARAAKADAVALHVSQVAPLSDEPGDEVLLGPELLAHFDGAVEVVFESPVPDDDALDRLHETTADPWHVESWYERRKRAVTLACLPAEHYGHVLEVGASVGALAEDLASRCDSLLAVDASTAAVASARTRLAALAHVRVEQARVPHEWPVGHFDLVSISEVGYFLSPAELDRLVRCAFASLTPHGQVLICHWRHDVVGWPLTAADVHDRFVSTGAPVLTEHRDGDFVLHVLGRP